MRKAWRQFLVSFVVVCILAVAEAASVQAQGQGLSIHLTHPNEGETFYAGPSSMLYMVPITGSVRSDSFAAEQLLVHIEIYQDSSQVLALELSPEADGSFEAFARVNPGSYSQEFAAEYITCGDVCHFNLLTQFQRKEWIPSLDLPQGPMLLVIRVTDPGGGSVSVERNIIVDRSDYAIVPVQVILLDGSPLAVENIPIDATTWLYMWRSRIGNGATDASGLAQVRVEALSQAPTSYRFQVKPLVVAGVHYEGITPVDIVLPPAATVGPLVTLRVRASQGTIRGRINGDMPLSQVQAWAIHLPDGAARITPVSPDGSFAFREIPIGKYLVTMDPALVAARGFTSPGQAVDLAQGISADVEVNLLPLDGRSLYGQVTGTDGSWLPFAWISFVKLDRTGTVMPDSGQYGLEALPVQKSTLVVDAPGYFSQAHVADLSSNTAAGMNFQLVRRPETRSLPWGNGEIIVPPETRISQSGRNIFLERGWLWGQNQADDPIVIQAGQVLINLSGGKFALEDVPGQVGWLYIFDGSGSLSRMDGSMIAPIQSGQMVALDGNMQYTAVPYDPVVVKTFCLEDFLPVTSLFQPTLLAQVSNRLALIGIDMAKLVTFITYLVVVISIILLPVFVIFRWIPNRTKNMDSTRK